MPFCSVIRTYSMKKLLLAAYLLYCISIVHGDGCNGHDTLWPISSATASSTTGPNIAANAIDKITSTRWESVQGASADPSWIYVDLGSERCISAVILVWATENARDYKIEGSNDAINWDSLRAMTNQISAFQRTDSLYYFPEHTGTYGCTVLSEIQHMDIQ